jgi:hypothetical protein
MNLMGLAQISYHSGFDYFSYSDRLSWEATLVMWLSTCPTLMQEHRVKRIEVGTFNMCEFFQNFDVGGYNGFRDPPPLSARIHFLRHA